MKIKLKESSFAATAQEEAEKINAQTGISLVTDQAYWEKSGISTGEELALELLASTYSDMYKSINGFRPRGVRFDSVEQVQAAIEALDGERDELDFDVDEDYRKSQEIIASLMPDELDTEYEPMAKQSGMGRGLRENTAQIVGSFRKYLSEGSVEPDKAGEVVASLEDKVKTLEPLLNPKAVELMAQAAEVVPELVGTLGELGMYFKEEAAEKEQMEKEMAAEKEAAEQERVAADEEAQAQAEEEAAQDQAEAEDEVAPPDEGEPPTEPEVEEEPAEAPASEEPEAEEEPEALEESFDRMKRLAGIVR